MATVTANPSTVINRRYDFVFLFDVTDGNPNGDPDAGNLPRLDPETLQGFVTDVCLKRKIRNAVAALGREKPGQELYFQTQDAVYERRILNLQHQRAYDALKEEGKLESDEKKSKGKAENTAKAREWMCRNFFDIRAFGAVMTTGVNCGQVRGPLQMTFARSLDRIVPMEIAITRKSVTTEKEAESQAKNDGSITGTMGRKSTIPYALYRGAGFVNPLLARDTGFTFGDLRLFFDAMIRMFDLDRSASRGLMTLRKVFVFEHESPLGNAPAHLLFDRVQTPDLGPEAAPRRFSDYHVAVDRENLPSGVTLYELPEEMDRLFPR
ncbi:MAG: type I-C CRISPR-associated protein Cas7/Csd2 [Planctomycetes bacterium]|nr:type I-C CRISPR-associated protein Cas7/Csd2 [Planctomycetota bacterium]